VIKHVVSAFIPARLLMQAEDDDSVTAAPPAEGLSDEEQARAGSLGNS